MAVRYRERNWGRVCCCSLPLFFLFLQLERGWVKRGTSRRGRWELGLVSSILSLFWDRKRNKVMDDEYQILYIWTPWFTLVRPLALLFSDVFVSFCVLVFYRWIREECQNFMWKYLEIQKSWKVDRSKFCLKSIDQNFPELTFAEARQNTQSRASPWQKAVLPLIFAAEHAGFVTLGVSSKRGTLEGVRWVILHEFLALISFYKAIVMPHCLKSSESNR
jgi:hypothetical protein